MKTAAKWTSRAFVPSELYLFSTGIDVTFQSLLLHMNLKLRNVEVEILSLIGSVYSIVFTALGAVPKETA